MSCGSSQNVADSDNAFSEANEELMLRKAMLEEARGVYLVQMNQLYRKKTSNSVLMNQHEYKCKLSRLLELAAVGTQIVASSSKNNKNSVDYRLLRAYEVREMEIPDTNRAVPRLYKRGTALPYMPFEEYFDILHSAHLHLKHAGRNSLQRFFRNKYANITKDCIMAYLSTCKNCPRPKRLPALIASHHRKWLSNVKTGEDEDDVLMMDPEMIAERQCCTPTGGSIADSGANQCADTPATTDGMMVSANARLLSTTPLHMHALQQMFSGGTFSSAKRSPSTEMLHLQQQRIGAKRMLLHSATTAVASATPAPQQLHQQAESFTRGQVDVFDMQTEPDGAFQFVLRYTNLCSHEVRLRPLRTTNAWEVADVLVDIYCEQGAPSVLQTLNGREFVEQVIAEVFKLWPRCRQLHADYSPPLASLAGASPDAIQVAFLAQLRDCAKRTEGSSGGGWSRALRHLQWELNTQYNPELNHAPIEASLGKIPSLGLRSSKFLDVIYDKARSEEQIMEFLQDAELLRLSAFCQQSAVPQTGFQISSGNGSSSQFSTSFAGSSTSRCDSPPPSVQIEPKKTRLCSSSSSSTISSNTHRSSAVQQQLVRQQQPNGRQHSQLVVLASACAADPQSVSSNSSGHLAPHSQQSVGSSYGTGTALYQPSPAASSVLPPSIAPPSNASALSNASVMSSSGIISSHQQLLRHSQQSTMEQSQVQELQTLNHQQELYQRESQHHHRQQQQRRTSTHLDGMLAVDQLQQQQQLEQQTLLQHQMPQHMHQQQPQMRAIQMLVETAMCEEAPVPPTSVEQQEQRRYVKYSAEEQQQATTGREQSHCQQQQIGNSSEMMHSTLKMEQHQLAQQQHIPPHQQQQYLPTMGAHQQVLYSCAVTTTAQPPFIQQQTGGGGGATLPPPSELHGHHAMRE